MNIFVTRQPVFDSSMSVFGYDLLYRENMRKATSEDGDESSVGTVVNGLLMHGVDELTDHRQSFITLPENLADTGACSLLPKDRVIIELHSESRCDLELEKRLSGLGKMGFRTAAQAIRADGRLFEAKQVPDILKVDFRQSDRTAITDVSKRYQGSPACLLASNIESHDEFECARKYGFTYFHGSFFSKPRISILKNLSSMNGSSLRTLKELGKREPDFAVLTDIIENDLSLSYKLLKLVNTCAFNGVHRITGIRNALARLGVNELRKWVALILMKDSGKDRPDELVRTSLVRARAMERLAEKIQLGSKKNAFFLVGVFSLMEPILDRPMQDILRELPLDAEISDALLGRQNLLKSGVDIILAYEKAEWDRIEEMSGIGVGLTAEKVVEAYFEAIQWTRALLVA